jgi:GLPGLI family protein
MNRNILIIILSFISAFAYGQNQRFIYEYKFVEDSTAKDKSKTEAVYLDVAKKGSKFYSRDKYTSDSILQDKSKKGSRDFSGIKYGLIPYAVEKSYPDYKVLFFNRLGMDGYKVTDERLLNWKILPDKEKIGEFNAQKATTYFAGRKWTAWFTADIPIQDGPYKFHGLPGLIIKAEDQTNSHSFILKEIKKLKPEQDWVSESDKQKFGLLIPVDLEKYKKVFIDSRNNPTKSLRQMIAGGTKVIMTDENGKEIDINESMRQQEKNAKEDNARNNNVIELDLLK